NLGFAVCCANSFRGLLYILICKSLCKQSSFRYFLCCPLWLGLHLMCATVNEHERIAVCVCVCVCVCDLALSAHICVCFDVVCVCVYSHPGEEVLCVCAAVYGSQWACWVMQTAVCVCVCVCVCESGRAHVCT